MVRVAPIKMQVGPKVLWFDPNDIEIHAQDNVIVSTERGIEFATATADIMEVSDELVAQLKSPLKPVLRIATQEDIARAEELLQKSADALPVFKSFAAQTNEDMHPVMVEFLFDGDKAVFYFEAEDRVDFRELVRKLAAHFHIRVDMRQIGVRDAARIVGGLGHCGQELCCKRMGGEFSPVSIRMAKEQNLSLNPQKISGVCGRLMCCLRYEYEAYKDVNSRAPKLNAKVSVEGRGEAKVSEINVPCERITLLFEDGKSVKIPLSEMEVTGEGKRPNYVREEVIETYANAHALSALDSSGSLLEVTNFTGEDKVADSESYADTKKRNKEKEQARTSRRPRRRQRTTQDGAEKLENTSKKGKGSDKQRQGSGKKNSSRSNNRNKNDRERSSNDSARKGGKKNSNQGNTSAKRPGQKSSGLRNNQNNQGSRKQTSSQPQNNGQKPRSSEAMAHRKSRRRRHTAGGETHENG